MNCKEFKELLERFLDDELDHDGQITAVKEHASQCPLCAMALENEKKFNKLVGDHIIKKEAPYELKEAVVNRLDEQRFGERLAAWFQKRKIPSLSAATALIVILAFTAVSTFSQPFPVFAESINRHVDYMKGGYPIEIRTNDVDEALNWFKGKLEFAVSRPHLDPDKVRLLGARICHLKGHKVAYFIYEKDGHNISAFVMDYAGLKRPGKRSAEVHDHTNNTVYLKGEKGYNSVFCYHKRLRTGCILVSELPQDELTALMG